METGYYASKNLTRDYQSFCTNRLHTLDVMVARRSWRKYEEWGIDNDILSQFLSFQKRSAQYRSCPEGDIVTITDDRLPEIFRKAYAGVIGKINPFLPKSKAAGVMILAIDKDVKKQDRPVSFAYPAMTGEDAVLFLTEHGLGSVWLAGINGASIAEFINLPSDKWVPMMIVFGRTGHVKPGGFNWDSFTHRTVSRRRKNMSEITCLDYYGNNFDIPSEMTQTLNFESHGSISKNLEFMSMWNKKTERRIISQIEWELLVESARIAPSASNKQPWKFVLIQDETMLEEFRKILNEKHKFSGIIAALGLSGTLYEVGFERPFWMIDVPIAISHITLMAGELNLASRVYMDINENEINAILKTGSSWRTTGLIGLR